MTNNLLPRFHFEVEWGGTRLGFQEVSGLTMEVDVIEYRDGLDKEYHMRKMPGMVKYSNIVLRRGIAKGDNELFNWWQTIQLHKVERRDITIKLLDEEHNPAVVWKVKNAFPAKLSYSALESDNSDVAIESMELAHEGISVEIG
jgi:phage tail-like protein